LDGETRVDDGVSDGIGSHSTIGRAVPSDDHSDKRRHLDVCEWLEHVKSLTAVTH
jgi:hypothetical protein